MKKKKSYWYFFKLQGDIAVYCQCTNCKWTTNVSSHVWNEEGQCYNTAIKYVPKYCQECGKKNLLYNGYMVYAYDWNGEHSMPLNNKVYPHQ